MDCDELRASEAKLLSQIEGAREAIAELLKEHSPTQAAQKRLDALQRQLIDTKHQIEVHCSGSPPPVTLSAITITFDTHDNGKDADTVVHVFVKSRSSDTSFSLGSADYVTNRAAWDRHEELGNADRHPFLGFAEALGSGTAFAKGSSTSFAVPLRRTPILLDEVDLPVVDLHILTRGPGILTNGADRWVFSWRTTFTFSDGRSFDAASDVDGISGIILDDKNRDHSGLCAQNPFGQRPPRSVPETEAVLASVELAFATHDDSDHDDDKAASTVLNVHIVNRLSDAENTDIAVANDVLPGTPFDDGSLHVVTFGANALPLASPTIAMRDIVLPVVYLHVVPAQDDQWAFDYQVTYRFSDDRAFTSRTSSVVLTAQQAKHAGAYQGRAFPTVTPPAKPALTGPAIDHASAGREKHISLAWLNRKLDEFVNNRQDRASQTPPLRLIRLHNAGLYGATEPESYVDIQEIDADPPPPGTITPPEYVEPAAWRSHPMSLGQLDYGLYLADVNSAAIRVKVDPSSPAPIRIEIDFETQFEEIKGVGTLGPYDLTSFGIAIGLTLGVAGGAIDAFTWIGEVDALLDAAAKAPPNGVVTGTVLGTQITSPPLSPATLDVFKDLLLQSCISLTLEGDLGLVGGNIRDKLLTNLYDKLRKPDPFDGLSARDRVNRALSSLLLGGAPATEFTDGTRVDSLSLDGDEIVIRYRGPNHTFEPPMPDGWPNGFDLTPGRLANIDHLVVLMMENRSFDHLLGYLHLPPERGGAGRDIDGLSGNEANFLDLTACPSFAFPVGDTVFSPDPPHGHEPVAKAVDGGKMDGFVRSFAEERGTAVAPRIMGYHTAENVPVFDALACDFAVGHRWFASHPGSTFPNRFYTLSGHLNIDTDGYWEFDNSSTQRPVFTPTIFDHLTRAGVSWKYFEHGYCFLRLFEQHTFDGTDIVSYDDPGLGFENLARAGALPAVSFIDPHYIEYPPGANCDGPPADIRAGQDFVRRVVEAVVTSPQWDKTLLLVNYDEHGGFYDHVAPPPTQAVTPDSLATYGVRVPAFAISPWVEPRSVFGDDPTSERPAGLYFDHTSILKTIVRRFLSSDPPRMGMRYAMANDLSAIVQPAPRPGPFRPFIPYTLTYRGSHKALEIRGGTPVPGAVIQQNDVNPSDAQRFSLEAADAGTFRVRTRTGRLYLTAQPDRSVVLAPRPPFGQPDNPAQRWTFTSVSITILDPDAYDIANVAFPGSVLLPAGNSTAIGVPLVLGPPPQSVPLGQIHWTVSSPLLPHGLVNA
jgi:phospholipase C